MPKQKKQHYVPQCYLKNFAIDKSICIYNHNLGKIIENAPYKGQCQSPYFYGQDLIWENKLQEYETKWGEIFPKIIKNQILTDDDIKKLKLFALYQRLRTKAENNHINKLSNQTVNYINSINSKYPESKYFINEGMKPSEYLNNAIEHENDIDDLDIVIITYNTQTTLISSDSPIIFINPFYNSIGLAVIGLVIYFPISSNKLVVIYDSKVYPDLKGQTYVVSTNEKEVQHLNNTQFIMSEEIIFAKTTSQLIGIGGKNKVLRQRNVENNKIHILGGEKNSMIHHSARKLFYDYEFSFAKLPKKLKQIPFNCRDMLPRKFDKEWAERIFIGKPRSLVTLFEIDNRKIPGIKSKKQLLKGIEDMTKFICFYWNIKVL